MSILFPDGLPDTDRKGNAIYTDFRNMLRIEALFNDDLTESEKLLYSTGLLYGEIPEGLSLEDAIRELMWFYTGGESDFSISSGAKTQNNKKLYDFEEDGNSIVASFFQAYGIDLTKRDMHWWTFLALFENLPPETAISQKMYYRGLDTTKMKGAQKKEAERLKKLYALKKKIPITKRDKSLRDRIQARYEEMKNYEK